MRNKPWFVKVNPANKHTAAFNGLHRFLTKRAAAKWLDDLLRACPDYALLGLKVEKDPERNKS